MQVFLWFDLFGRFVLIRRFRNLVKADPEKDTFRISEKKKTSQPNFRHPRLQHKDQTTQRIPWDE